MESLLAVAALADGLTMLFLPPGSEFNPAGRSLPLIALALKVALAIVLLELARRKFPRFGKLPLLAAAAWSFGTLTNLAVILRLPFHL